MIRSIRYPATIAALLAVQAWSPMTLALGDSAFDFKTAQDLIEVCGSDAQSAAFCSAVPFSMRRFSITMRSATAKK